MKSSDKAIIRELATRVAEIAALPVQEEKRTLWRKLNGLRPERPMVMIDQICWNELNGAGELTLQCEDEECRRHEQDLRRTLYRWNHFPVDRVVEPYVVIGKTIRNVGFGLKAKDETLALDPGTRAKSHRYKNQLETEEDLEKICVPCVEFDAATTEKRLEIAHTLFDGILDVRLNGCAPYVGLWDPISTWMGVENALWALADKPDYMHKLLNRMTHGYLGMLDQLEEQGLLCSIQNIIHCTGAYTDELPADGYDPEKPRTRDIWMFGLAQMFSTVSPDMFREFEADYASRICERFGLVYYGCCDPLDRKMDQVRMIPNVRKVSMSPWVNEELGAENIGKDFVYSRKPNPAHVAMDRFDAELVRNDLANTRKICEKHGCPLEFTLKDISTVRYEAGRLDEWARIAMEVVGG